MKKALLVLILLFIFQYNYSQKYEFKDIINIACTPVISQDVTGTCWSYATSSFLESEIIRITGKQIDLSEMYNVRNTYMDKAENYVMRQGKAQFSQGGLAHDVINSVEKYGIVPANIFTGLGNNEIKHNHIELEEALLGMLKSYASAKKLSPKWKQAVESVLDVYLGSNPTEFVYEGENFTAKSFLSHTKINPTNYVSITSFTHEPYYKSFILNIPDNFSNGQYYNLPLDEFMANINHALDNGYSLSLDCDVSEPTFSAKEGVAIIPADEKDVKTILTEIKLEKAIDADYRQQEFENFTTTDDHLMHIVGKAKDQNGTVYYKVKNSWGSDSERVANGGYIYMSESYIRLKTISVMVHKDGLLKETLKKWL